MLEHVLDPSWAFSNQSAYTLSTVICFSGQYVLEMFVMFGKGKFEENGSAREEWDENAKTGNFLPLSCTLAVSERYNLIAYQLTKFCTAFIRDEKFFSDLAWKFPTSLKAKATLRIQRNGTSNPFNRGGGRHNSLLFLYSYKVFLFIFCCRRSVRLMRHRRLLSSIFLIIIEL